MPSSISGPIATPELASGPGGSGTAGPSGVGFRMAYRYPRAGQRAWRQWYGWAIRSRIPPLVAFARNLKRKLPGILAHCRYPLHTGVLEGINNTIKVLKRMAYGFRDDGYFFLKIRAAFPGIP